MDERAKRIAQNEARFRDINERLRTDLRALPDDAAAVTFVCECGRIECDLSVELPLTEYEGVRADPLLFTIVPGHELTDVEDVVKRAEGYAVVRKHEETAPIARETDPRSDD